MREALNNIIDAAETLRDHLDELSKTEDKLNVAKAELVTTTKQHDDIAAALADKTLLLDSARANAIKTHDKEMYDKAEELKKLKSQVDSLCSERDQLKVEVDSARIEHEGVLASLESLRKKHFA